MLFTDFQLEPVYVLLWIGFSLGYKIVAGVLHREHHFWNNSMTSIPGISKFQQDHPDISFSAEAKHHC